MGDMWKANQEIMDMVKNLVATKQPDLTLVVDEIAVVFQEKAGKKGGQVSLGSVQTASPLLNALCEEDYKFIIKLPADEWHDLTHKQREALLFHFLCGCRVVEDAESGDIKCSVAPPDVDYYYDELDEYGDWRPRDPEDDGPTILDLLQGTVATPEMKAKPEDSKKDTDAAE